ncbi:MAG: HAMP domain-containing sensor histidine kinase [Prochloraceae cyanobacterium]|nr:HAMP domain-containing sensor histidine kinase [Prochloraceae cyanobacterium]
MRRIKSDRSSENFKFVRLWGNIFWEARTRILFWYTSILIFLIAPSFLAYREIVYSRVDARVKTDLIEELNSFEYAYKQWRSKNNSSSANLKKFIKDFLNRELPADDNYLIAIVDGRFYKSSPRALPKSLNTDSRLMNYWATLSQSDRGEYEVSDREIVSILYIAQTIVIEGKVGGIFVAAHTTAGEREEALQGAIVFLQVTAIAQTLALIFAWLISGRVLAPLRELTVTASSIKESDLSQRIPVRGSGEIAELTKTFNSMMDRLQGTFTSQKNFINDAGHELRTPITIIRGHLELLGDDPEEKKETLALVLDELDRMSRIVNELIFLAKAERPDFLKLETVDVALFAEELFTKIKALGKRNWQLKNKAMGKIIADRQRLTQAIMNLANNAVFYTHKEDSITFGSELTDKEIRFWVQDTGVGISPGEQKRIFERFARCSNSRTRRRSEGAGLGLPIVQAIAVAHQGRVELFSEPNVGSTFTIVIPYKFVWEVSSNESHSHR